MSQTIAIEQVPLAADADGVIRVAGLGKTLLVEQLPFSNVAFGSGHHKNPTLPTRALN